MTILITGGAGFIGSNFVHEWLASADEPIINLDKLTYAGHRENLSAAEGDARHTLVVGDIADSTLVTDLLMRHQPRAIVNFAAESHVDRSINGPRTFIDTNIVGTFTLLEAARDYWQQQQTQSQVAFRFLQVSTDEVYGTLAPEEDAFTEQHPYRPNSPYSASKASADHVVRAYHHTYGLPVLTTHCSNNYGPYQYPEKLIPLMILKAQAGNPLPIYGDGQQVRDWLHVRDHCAALRHVLARGTPGETYNIGGWNEHTNLEVVHRICALLDTKRPRSDGKSYADQITFVADRPGHDRRYAIDATKIAHALQWKPAQAFNAGLEQTVDWYLTHSDWVAQVTRD